ncbi:hypothetical protein N177_0485 [Lutibaculum baratangense AMV1]|uniref:Secreted protein n=1 Tax=Lutibaculum baratangense AMV1 TaxID=631454 RepID=V4RKV9_9HYPH|nr:hypothetical protein N177_0485 [Lutibaculum baratangense AMV1]
MLRRGLATFALAASALSAASSVQAQGQERWELNAGHEVCVVGLGAEPVLPGISRVNVVGACGGALRNLAGYSVERDGHTIMFYAISGGTPTQVARVDLEQPGVYVGMIGDGDGLTMVQQGMQQTGPGPSAGPRTCVPYYGTSECAAPQDLGVPASTNQFAYEVWLQPVVNLNLRAMPGLDGAKMGSVERICVQADECRPQTDGAIWCSMMMGSVPVWFLKQDRAAVYAKVPDACG